MSSEIHKFFLTGVIDRIEEKQAIIRLEDKQELYWPLSRLPKEVKEGTALRLVLTTSQTDEEEREKLAKTILKEILKSD